MDLRGAQSEPRVFAQHLAAAPHGLRTTDKLTVDYLRLQFTLAASERAVRRWLSSLEAVGLIDVLHRAPRQAEIRIRDWRQPRPEDQPTAPLAPPGHSQLGLPFAETAPEDTGPVSIPIWAGAKQRPVRRPTSDKPTAG